MNPIPGEGRPVQMAQSSQLPGGRFDFDDGGFYCGGWEEGKATGHGKLCIRSIFNNAFLPQVSLHFYLFSMFFLSTKSFLRGENRIMLLPGLHWLMSFTLFYQNHSGKKKNPVEFFSYF